MCLEFRNKEHGRKMNSILNYLKQKVNFKLTAPEKYLASAGHHFRQSALRAGHLQFVPVTICYENLKIMYSKFKMKRSEAIYV